MDVEHDRGKLGPTFITKDTAWKYAFLIGAIPAFLCVFIQFRLKEPEKWVKAEEGANHWR